MRTTRDARARGDGGTRLVYEVEATPRNVARPRRDPARDRRDQPPPLRRPSSAATTDRPRRRGRRCRAPKAAARARAAAQRIEAAAARASLDGRRGARARRPPRRARRRHGDDLTVARLRPYELADDWGSRPPRDARALPPGDAARTARAALGAPLPALPRRGRRARPRSAPSAGSVHCETCRIDFTADFDRSVEVTFRPVAAIRPVGAPRVLRRRAAADAARRRAAARPAGRAAHPRARGSSPAATACARSADGAQLPVAVAAGGASAAAVRLGARTAGRRGGDLSPRRRRALAVENATAAEQLVVLERTAWSDHGGDRGRGDRAADLPRPLRRRGARARRADLGRQR